MCRPRLCIKNNLAARAMRARQDNSNFCPNSHAVDLWERSQLNRELGEASRFFVVILILG